MEMVAQAKAADESEPQPLELPPDPRANERMESGFEIIRKKKAFTVIGDRLERIVAITNMRDHESIGHLHRVLRSMGVIDALIAAGARPGVDVIIGGMTFTYGDEWQ
jgi:GTP-binding protein